MNVTFKTLKKHDPTANWNEGFNLRVNGKEPVFYTHAASGLPEWKSWEVLNNRQGGWYTNHDGTTYKDGSGLAHGLVLMLPNSPGFPEGRFLAGYLWGDNGEICMYPEIFREKEEAARKADSHAKAFAELCQEDSYKFEQFRKLEEAVEEESKRVEECFTLRNYKKFKHLREEVSELCKSIRKTKKRMAEDYPDYG